MLRTLSIISTCGFAFACGTTSAVQPDHVVIVIEENHSFSSVIGNPEAPFINALAAGGASFTSFYAITHPSQPNYLHMFSGESQNVFDNTAPAPGSPFNTPNFGAALINAGRTFIGYSEDLPAPGSTIAQVAGYYRKHNPWVNWQVDEPAPGGNQLPPSVNLPFTMFPSDFSLLPDVAIVVPNIVNDMHDGTIAQGDAWLQANLGAYAQWALAHNSLLVLTFDEDESAERNRIPTLVYGPGVRVGTIAGTWTAHNLLRTMGDWFGAAPPGSAAQTPPIVGIFEHDPAVTTRAFQRGSLGPSAVVSDTFIEPANPSFSRAGATTLVADGSPLSQMLVRFDAIFGPAPDQVPIGANVVSAKLLLLTGAVSGDSSVSPMRANRMLAGWDESSTWNSMVAGVSLDDVEAATAPEFAVVPNVLSAWAIFDVTESLQQWSGDTAANHGWVIHPGGSDGWRLSSSEVAAPANRPMLEVTYLSPPPACAGDADSDGKVSFADITSALTAWETPGPFGDANHDGFVNFEDITTVLSNWGSTCR